MNKGTRSRLFATVVAAGAVAALIAVVTRRSAKRRAVEHQLGVPLRPVGDLTAASVGMTRDEIMRAVQTRLAAKRQSISKWRARHDPSDYPKRMAANLIGADILNARLARRAPSLFQQGQADPVSLQRALEVVTKESSTIQKNVIDLVERRINGRIGSLEPEFQEPTYQALMGAASAGANRDNVSVEKIEYNWVFNALTTDMMELWLGLGLSGLNMQSAFEEAFYFVQADPDLTSTDGIRRAFHGLATAMLSAPGAYRQEPNLW